MIPVSVIIPAFNAEAWLARAVTSVLGDGVDEIVIIDDGSTDDTALVAKELSKRHACITFRSLALNVGAASARREAVALARNEWVAPLDSDDYLGPHAVSTAFQQVEADHADICIWIRRGWTAAGPETRVGWRRLMFRVVDGRPSRYPDASSLLFPIPGREAARLTLGGWRIHPTGVVRKEVFARAAESVNVDSYNSDELVTRSLFLGSRLVTACKAEYFYVDNPESTTRAVPADILGLARSQTWLLRFALENGFLDEDPSLATSLVRDGLTLADAVRRSGSLEDLTMLLDLLDRSTPSLRRTGLRELYRTLRGRGSRQRVRALRSQGGSIGSVKGEPPDSPGGFRATGTWPP